MIAEICYKSDEVEQPYVVEYAVEDDTFHIRYEVAQRPVAVRIEYIAVLAYSESDERLGPSESLFEEYFPLDGNAGKAYSI